MIDGETEACVWRDEVEGLSPLTTYILVCHVDGLSEAALLHTVIYWFRSLTIMSAVCGVVGFHV